MLAAFALTLVLGSPPQDEDPLKLSWDAPPGCPDERWARAEIATLLGGELREPSAVVVRVHEERGELVAEIRVRESPDRTELRAHDCEVLGHAVALVVAVALDPFRVSAVVEPITGASGSAAAQPNAVEDPSRAGAGPPTARRDARPERAPRGLSSRSRRSARPRRADATTESPSRREPIVLPLAEPPELPNAAKLQADWVIDRPRRAARNFGEPRPREHRLRVAGGVGLTAVPLAAGAIALGYALQIGPGRLELVANYSTPRRRFYADDPTKGGVFQSVVVGARGCYAPRTRSVVFPLCGGVEAGAVIGRGLGAERTRTAAGAHAGAVVGAALVIALHPIVGLYVGADLLVPITRSRFGLGQRGPLFPPPVVGGRGLLGLELRVK